jgi:hypothetical protein
MLTSVFDVGNLMSCQQQVSCLFHAKSIVLQYLAREHNMLYKRAKVVMLDFFLHALSSDMQNRLLFCFAAHLYETYRYDRAVLKSGDRA